MTVKKFFKNLDLFGLPVNLTYQGENYFKTSFGGCVSILLVLGVIALSISSFMSLYLTPNFQVLPEDFDFSKTNLTIDFQATTVAIGMSIFDSNLNASQAYTNQYARVRFQLWHNSLIKTPVDAVYCEDLYAE